MARIQIDIGTQYQFQEQRFQIIKQLPDNQYLVENQSSGVEESIANAAIVTAWQRGELRFLPSYTNPSVASNPLNQIDLSTLPASVQETVWRRHALVLALFDHLGLAHDQRPTRSQIADFIKDQATTTEDHLPSARTLNRYVAAFVESGADIRSLLPKNSTRGGKGQSRLDPAVEQIITTILDKYAAITARISTVDQVMADITMAVTNENRSRSAEPLRVPSERTIRRRIGAAGEHIILGRRLSRREQKATAGVQRGVRPTRILERVEIDHTTLDLFVVDEQDGLPIGRPHITACIDKYSAIVPGWHIGFNRGGYTSIMLCLQHAFLPKPDYRERYGTQHLFPVFGLFEKLCIDNGRDFRGSHLKNALAALGIIREEMPPHTPWFKGSIERYFRTVNQRLLKGSPGYTFENAVALGDYNPQKDAVISFSSFIEIFHIFMVDIYPHSWHAGIEAIPMQRWREASSRWMPPIYDDAEALKRLLLPSAERRLQPRGIEWNNNFYRSPALARLRELHDKNKVRFKFNPDNIDEIYVRDEQDPTGWTTFCATNPDYTRGLSLAKHHLIRQFVNAQKKSVDALSLAQAKSHIQQIIEREFIATRKMRRRSRLKPLVEHDDSTQAAPPVEPVPASLEAIPETNPTSEVEGWSSDYLLPFSKMGAT